MSNSNSFYVGITLGLLAFVLLTILPCLAIQYVTHRRERCRDLEMAQSNNKVGWPAHRGYSG